MWKAFALLYGLIFVFLLALAFYPLPPEVTLDLSANDRALFYASLIVDFATATGLFAYAFDLKIPPFSLWRPFSWLLAGWLLYTSLARGWDFVTLLTAPQPGDEGVISASLGLLLLLLLNYFGWLGVWRYADRIRQQSAAMS